MLNKTTAIVTLHTNAAAIAAVNKRNYENGTDHKLKYGRSQCAHYVKVALISGGVSSVHSGIRSAKDYGPWLLENKFKAVQGVATEITGGVYSISGQQTGDVVVIAASPDHPDGHMAMFDGVKWVSDFTQDLGFYPGKAYRNHHTSYVLYRYSEDGTQPTESIHLKGKIKICYPILKQNRQEFMQQADILAHLSGEATGTFMLGRNGMWHGGIHITNATTPWCALSGKAASEAVDFPVPYKGEQAVRCMADGEVVAYRICRDYVDAPWETGPMKLSGSFVLVRHYIQPGEKKESGLHFYTLYMHLAPWSAYDAKDGNKQWKVNDSLSAYSPEWLLSAGADSKSVNDAYRVGTMPKGALVEWDDTDSNLHTTSRGRSYGLVTFKGLSAEDTKSKTSLKAGQQYWLLVDKKNVVPADGEATRPAWWTQLLPPFTETMKFDSVTCPTPYAIKAGDAVGHLGYFQAPKEGGYEARYQVHIECLSMDENLETFLKNPEKVGQNSPVWLKCPKGLALYQKDVKTGVFTSGGRPTEGEVILKLSQLKTEADAKKHEYWYLPFANGYTPVNGKGTEKLSQYDLEKLGFKTTTDDATTFDHLDGKTPPKGLVRTLFETLLDASSNDTRASHSAVPHNYQRLLDRIDGGISPYSPQEYLSAVHNPSYRDATSRLIVKHPSEWYYKKGDVIWQPFLDNLKKDAPEWKAYSEGYIEKMGWMQDVAKEKLGSMLWHMHPVEFLGALMPIIKHTGKITGKEFVTFVFTEAQKIEESSRVPAAITTAQAILETGYGKSVPTDVNSKRYSYNIFGIKAHGDPEYVEDYTHEVENGKRIKVLDKFKAYDSYDDSISGRANFFQKNARYHFLFESNDPIEWAKGLQKAGYATDPNYANSLISVMKSQGLI